MSDRTTLPAFSFLDDLSQPSALVWVVAELALALRRLGRAVSLRPGPLTDTVDAEARRELAGLMAAPPDPDGIQLKWAHYWPQHLELTLSGRVNLELFVINYRFGQPGRQPWDYWLQSLRQTHTHKLAVTGFCREVLAQVGVPAEDCDVLPLGYAREVHEVGPPAAPAAERFRFLTVTNSHDLARYGTARLLEAYWEAFGPRDPVVLTVRDYGVGAADPTLRDLIQRGGGRARVEYRPEFTSKRALIELYRTSDAFVSAHRGEGFGMKLLDALACGLPVITPLFGGPTEYCTPATCYPVRFALSPMGECLDSRSLRITNEPLWAEPDRGDLARQLRAVYEAPEAARAVGAAGRRAVLERYSWEATARRLTEIVEALERRAVRGEGLPGAMPAGETPRATHRLSVLVPTHNRKETLLKCLEALEKQTVGPGTFEVVVVDDGSTDGTEAALAGQTFGFPLRYHRQPNQGPGAARNAAMALAQGEVVLFIGDDIIAEERLLEQHLLAHTRYPAPGAAILGHIDWPPWLSPNPVMEHVCGEGGQQFAYHYLSGKTPPDFKFFYTSNISLKRRFLWEALRAGVRFDPCFRYAAFEDGEFAYRLGPRGLAIHYWKDALAYHDHWMDLESFARREYHVGQMAVVFYRKHPELDEILDVRWIADWTDAVETLRGEPAAIMRVKALDAHTDGLLRALEGTLEAMGEPASPGVPRGPARGGQPDPLRAARHRLLALIFAVERTRGRVDEWYRDVADRETVAAAQALLGGLLKLEYVTAHSRELAELQRKLYRRWLGEGRRPPLAPGVSRAPRLRVILGARLFGLAREADRALQRTLREPRHVGWLLRYRRLRRLVKRLTF